MLLHGRAPGLSTLPSIINHGFLSAQLRARRPTTCPSSALSLLHHPRTYSSRRRPPRRSDISTDPTEQLRKYLETFKKDVENMRILPRPRRERLIQLYDRIQVDLALLDTAKRQSSSSKRGAADLEVARRYQEIEHDVKGLGGELDSAIRSLRVTSVSAMVVGWVVRRPFVSLGILGAGSWLLYSSWAM